MQDASENVVLALMAHPDDAEILCGGTLALLARQGWSIHLATATAGDCGSGTLGPEEIAAIRRQEARSAAGLLGGTFHCLDRRDLQVRYDAETLVAGCAYAEGFRQHRGHAYPQDDLLALTLAGHAMPQPVEIRDTGR